MRHVGRFDSETKLPITEVTQAELDALPTWHLQTCLKLGSMWSLNANGKRVLAYNFEQDGVCKRGYRRLVVVESAEPARA